MFLGTHTPRLDDKGRVILPAKFRDELAGGVVITKGQERCLCVFPTAEFSRYAAEQSARPMSDRAARAFTRLLFSGAHDEVPDKQGRITIPPMLREYAGLERDLVVIGASSRVEIWDSAVWQAYLAANEEDFASLDDGGPGPDSPREVVPGGD